MYIYIYIYIYTRTCIHILYHSILYYVIMLYGYTSCCPSAGSSLPSSLPSGSCFYGRLPKFHRVFWAETLAH